MTYRTYVHCDQCNAERTETDACDWFELGSVRGSGSEQHFCSFQCLATWANSRAIAGAQ